MCTKYPTWGFWYKNLVPRCSKLVCFAPLSVKHNHPNLLFVRMTKLKPVTKPPALLQMLGYGGPAHNLLYHGSSYCCKKYYSTDPCTHYLFLRPKRVSVFTGHSCKMCVLLPLDLAHFCSHSFVFWHLYLLIWWSKLQCIFIYTLVFYHFRYIDIFGRLR